MRITVAISDDVHREAKLLASQSGKTLSQIFEEAIREMLLRQRETRRKHRPLPVFSTRTGGTLPGINLDNNAQLSEMMDLEDWNRWNPPGK